MSSEAQQEEAITDRATTPEIGPCDTCRYLCFKIHQYRAAYSQAGGKNVAGLQKPECPQQGDMSDMDFLKVCKDSER